MIYPLKDWHNLKRGYKFKQRTWYSRYHLGLDLIAPKYTEIFAPCDGFIKPRYGFQGGKTIWFYFESKRMKYIMRVLHLNAFGKEGKVKEGDIIGYVGNTGYTIGPTGCHVHFDVRGAANPFAY